MPKPLMQYDNGDLTGVVGTSVGQTLRWDGSAWVAATIPYDLSGNTSGVPDANADIFLFPAVRDFTLAATGHKFKARFGPATPTVTFSIRKNGVEFATAAFTASGSDVSATVTITNPAALAFTVDDLLAVVSPANVDTVSSLYFTFAATCAAAA